MGIWSGRDGLGIARFCPSGHALPALLGIEVQPEQDRRVTGTDWQVALRGRQPVLPPCGIGQVATEGGADENDRGGGRRSTDCVGEGSVSGVSQVRYQARVRPVRVLRAGLLHHRSADDVEIAVRGVELTGQAIRESRFSGSGPARDDHDHRVILLDSQGRRYPAGSGRHSWIRMSTLCTASRRSA